jgi:protein-S-isoprenylcysteine O-methyltransferase Ste14
MGKEFVKMNQEIIFRSLFLLAFIAMMVIRHPIYTAYLLNYAGGGLLSGNVVLTVVPVLMFAIMISIRMGQEENVLVEIFAQKYREYMNRTGRLLPRRKT